MAIVSYTRMADMTEADLALINADADEDARELPGRLMDAVAELERFQGAAQGQPARALPAVGHARLPGREGQGVRGGGAAP